MTTNDEIERKQNTNKTLIHTQMSDRQQQTCNSTHDMNKVKQQKKQQQRKKERKNDFHYFIKTYVVLSILLKLNDRVERYTHTHTPITAIINSSHISGNNNNNQ